MEKDVMRSHLQTFTLHPSPFALLIRRLLDRVHPRDIDGDVLEFRRAGVRLGRVAHEPADRHRRRPVREDADIPGGQPLADARPDLDIAPPRGDAYHVAVVHRPRAVQLEIDALYQGYLGRQEADIQAFRRDEALLLPADLDYGAIGSLSAEIRQKLNVQRPATLGQAARIAGVTPAALVALLKHVRRRARAA